jgi:hypothetical protein
MSARRAPGGRDAPRGRVEVAAAIAYVACFLVWYPSTFAIVDESTYLSTAYVYRAGTIFSDVARVESVSRVRAGGHEVSKFAPLWPAALALFTLPGWRGAFLANLAVHLAGFALFARLVRRAGLPAWTSLLYLAHPTLVYYSRTLMSDLAAGVLFLAAWWHWGGDRRRSAVLAGVWAGLSCAVRYTNVALVALFAAASALDDLRRPPGRSPRTLPMILGALPPALALAIYNQAAFGTWWRGTDGYRGDQVGPGLGGQFGPHVFASGLQHYAGALLAAFPLMLPAVFLYRGRDRLALSVVSLGFTLLFCFYYYQDRSNDFLRTAVVGLRFLVPVLPLYLLAYADVLARAFRAADVGPRAATIGGAVAAALAIALVSARHQGYLRPLDAERRRLYALTTDGSTILCDTAARKLLHDVWGERRAVRVEFRDRWEIPALEEVGGAGFFVAMAGRGAREPMPEPLAGLLAASGARPVAQALVGSRLRLWEVPRRGARPDATGLLGSP